VFVGHYGLSVSRPEVLAENGADTPAREELGLPWSN
jgi:hypothetical protein